MSVVTTYNEWSRKIRESDEKAFHELFMESYNPLLRYANTFIKDSDAVKDILQEVYAHLWQIRERIDMEKSLKALLYKMTKNRCINYLRAQQSIRLDELAPAEQPTVEMDSGEIDPDADSELERSLSVWIEQLPARQREAFELSRFEGLDHHEIADFMDCAPRTVNNHIVNALKTLRAKLDESQRTES